MTEQETEEELLDPDEDLDEDPDEDAPKPPKRPRRSVFKVYKAWVSSLPRRQAFVVVTITIALLVFGLIYLSAVIVYEPWYTNEFEQPIDRESQWIEVDATPFEFNAYVDEGQIWTQGFDFPTDGERGVYVAEFTAFLIWIDDARTGPDTFQFTVYDAWGKQVAAGGSNSGQTMQTMRLNNTAVKHVENYQGWTVEVTCLRAEDGFLGPGGFITIPDDGNDFTFRFEWSYFMEHNPEWE